MQIKSIDELPSVKKYLDRISGKAVSFRTAAVQERVGKYLKDICKIVFYKDGNVVCSNKKYNPDDKELERIADELKEVDFPTVQLMVNPLTLPKEVSDASPDDIFELRNHNNELVMIHLKCTNKEGAKYYIPFTYWSDGMWRQTEPDCKIPLFGIEKINNHTTVFLHEGAKAAKNVLDMVAALTDDQKEKLKNHPWGKELSNAAHLGWVGGAHSVYKTNFSQLNKMGVKRVYIVSDNDLEGVCAVQEISKYLRVLTFHVQFTNEWPATFDLGDDFPPSMFKILDGKKRYIGPSFNSCLHPATWATDYFKPEKGPAVLSLRDNFKDMWAYVETTDLFVCKEMPSIVRQEKILNKILAPFSHTYETSKLILKSYTGRTTSICYRPDMSESIISDGISSSINLHIPSDVKSENGDPTPFLNFLEYMFPLERERINVQRWLATLISRLDVKMDYGLILISEATGIGKTTLGSKILAPLVGLMNVGYPREADIVDTNFNGWVANKRLVIVNEIYSGHSWKAYHSLKSLITDKEITVNQKYQRPYIIENWCHIFACSNSRRALKMEGDDRRWFYPEITEERWGIERFAKFRDWIFSGGLGIIKNWADNFNNYVVPGERAPMTERKREMIEGSRSEAQSEAVIIAETLNVYDKPAAIPMKEIVTLVRDSVQGRVFDSDYELRKAMQEVGVYTLKKRIRVGGIMQYIIVNDKLNKLIKTTRSESEIIDLVKNNLVRSIDLFEPHI